MSYCSYCNYFAPTNARLQRHLNTNKHARNFMLVDAGIQELIPPDEPPANENDIPDLVRTNDDDNSETVFNDDLSELDSLQIFDGLPYDDDDDDLPELNSIPIVDLPSDTDSTSDDDDLPEVVDVSTNTFDFEFKYVPIDESTREMANASFSIVSSISQFFDDHPYAYHLLHVIGFVGLIFFKSKLDKNALADTK